MINITINTFKDKDMEIIEEWLKKRYTEKNKKSEKINEENFETSNQIIEQDVDDVFGLNGTNYGE